MSSLEVLEGLEPVESDVQRITVRRAAVEVLHARLDLLDSADRALLRMHLDAGSSFDEIARLTRRNRSSVCRRIHRMIGRLRDETYVRCRAAHEWFSEAELAVVRDHFVRGSSLRRICRDHNLCYYRVHRIIERARRLAPRTEAE